MKKTLPELYTEATHIKTTKDEREFIKWFPETKMLFKNFKMKSITIEVERLDGQGTMKSFWENDKL